MFQTYVFKSSSVKTFEIGHFPRSLSLFWYFIENLNIDFVVFLLISILFNLVCDNVSLNFEYISQPRQMSTVGLMYSSALLTF